MSNSGLVVAIAAALAMPAAVAAEPYYSTTNLPASNPSAASDNPLKGFLTSPLWTPNPRNDLPLSLDFYYVSLRDVMDGPKSFTGLDTFLEPKLVDSATNERHAVLRFYLDYPSKSANYEGVPQFLVDGGLAFDDYAAYGGGKSPDYSDQNLLDALQSFITELGRRYDADTRVAVMQAGLLGFWAEWHTYTTKDEGWIPQTTKDSVVRWFETAFPSKQVQFRYPEGTAVASTAGNFGLHDDSFAQSTLDGDAAGGETVSWFLWPRVVSSSYTDFWRTGMMGGELRPELQSTAFDSNYPVASAYPYNQDYMECVETTHATYMLNYYAFGDGYQGDALVRAQAASDRMGYAFEVTGISASVGAVAGEVDVTVAITQTGPAPFYYPLSVKLSCQDYSEELPGVNLIVAEGDAGTFVFTGVPDQQSSLDTLSISLTSPYAYSGRPVKFAQGTDGTAVTVSVPTSSTSPPAPTPVTEAPTKAPVPAPTPTPVTEAPTEAPVPAPTPGTPAPVEAPTAPCQPCMLRQEWVKCSSNSQCCSGTCSGNGGNRRCTAYTETCDSAAPPTSCKDGGDFCSTSSECCNGKCKGNNKCS